MRHAILVIEGDTTLREGIASTLRREGYFVLAVADVSLAEAIVHDNPLALIVLDLLPLLSFAGLSGSSSGNRALL